MDKVTAADVEALVQIFDESDWDELHVEMDGFEIYLSKDPQGRPQRAGAPPSELPAPLARAAAAAPAAAGAKPPAATPSVPAGWTAVRAPNLGTFYRAPKPGAPPYVEVGQSVTADTELCLLEVMKLFTAVRAGTAGVVRQICVGDAEMVEFDQVLFLIEPQAG